MSYRLIEEYDDSHILLFYISFIKMAAISPGDSHPGAIA